MAASISLVLHVDGVLLVSQYTNILFSIEDPVCRLAILLFWFSCLLWFAQKQAKTALKLGFRKCIFAFWGTSTQEVQGGLRRLFVGLLLLHLLVYLFGQDQQNAKRYAQFSLGAWSLASEKVSVFRWSQEITRAISNWVVELEKLYTIILLASYVSASSSRNKQNTVLWIQNFVG